MPGRRPRHCSRAPLPNAGTRPPHSNVQFTRRFRSGTIQNVRLERHLMHTSSSWPQPRQHNIKSKRYISVKTHANFKVNGRTQPLSSNGLLSAGQTEDSYGHKCEVGLQTFHCKHLTATAAPSCRDVCILCMWPRPRIRSFPSRISRPTTIASDRHTGIGVFVLFVACSDCSGL